MLTDEEELSIFSPHNQPNDDVIQLRDCDKDKILTVATQKKKKEKKEKEKSRKKVSLIVD